MTPKTGQAKVFLCDPSTEKSLSLNVAAFDREICFALDSVACHTFASLDRTLCWHLIHVQLHMPRNETCLEAVLDLEITVCVISVKKWIENDYFRLKPSWFLIKLHFHVSTS